MYHARVRRWIRHNRVSAAGIVLALAIVLASVLSPWLAPYEPDEQDLYASLMPPTISHPLGTDHLGRDILSRVMWAGRVSLTITSAVLILSMVLGGGVGLIAGYTGGWVDQVVMRLVDLFLALPTLILALALIGILGARVENLILALTISWWPPYARLVRSTVQMVRSQEFVMASQALGSSPLQIMRLHVLPALLGPVAVLLSLDTGSVVLTIAGLSFLGLGIQPPTPEWGTMLVDARPFMEIAPYLIVPPGLVVLLTVFGFNSLSEGLESWLNPWSGNILALSDCDAEAALRPAPAGQPTPAAVCFPVGEPIHSTQEESVA